MTLAVRRVNELFGDDDGDCVPRRLGTPSLESAEC